MAVKIALLGFGTVASGVPFLLTENHEKMEQVIQEDVIISKVLVRNEAEKARLEGLGHSYDFVTDISAILSDKEIAIVVELMGRIEPAKLYITEALKAGKHVVTANKDLLAVHGAELQALAQEQGVALYYEAAVAGGIPILRTLANSFVSDKITRILGVLNGTSNFMMTKMVDEGWTYEKALQTAQELGYAESDPTNDVEGIDAAYKAVILSQFAFGMNLAFEQVTHKGISTIRPEDVAVAQELGYVIKLVGDLQETPSGIAAEVSPTFLPKGHPLASVNGVMNAVFVESIGIGESMFYGPGAGQKPTATSVVADILRVVARMKNATVGKTFNEFSRPVQLAKAEDVKSGYYFSIQTPDRSGKMLALAEIFHSEEISFKQILQHSSVDGQANLVIVTHAMSKTQLGRVTEKLTAAPDFTVVNIFKVLGE